MKILAGLLFACLSINLSAICTKPFNGEKAATHFYIVNLDEQILDMFNQFTDNCKDQQVNPIKKEFTANVIDSIYAISAQMIKMEIGLELLPLSELQNKI